MRLEAPQEEPPAITAEEIDDLTEAVITLSQEVRLLRHSVDEIEQELGWAIRTKVLSQIPRPEYPCDERLELVEPNDTSHSKQHWEHACDPGREWHLPYDERSPAAPPTIPSAPAKLKQSQLW